MSPIYEFKNAHKDYISYVTQVDVNTVWTASTDATIGIWKVKPPSIKVASLKIRSNSLKDEGESPRNSGSSPNPLAKFTSVPLNKAKKLHPCLFPNSHIISTAKKVKANKKPKRSVVSNITKFMKN